MAILCFLTLPFCAQAQTDKTDKTDKTAETAETAETDKTAKTSKTSRAPLQLQENDTVVWLGATFFERMQQFGHLETELHCRNPKTPLRFRNLGWSADTVTGISRAVFGSEQDGFKRLHKDLKTAGPSVIVVQYGAVESELGQAGEPQFTKQLAALLDSLEPYEAKIVLLSPFHRTRPRDVFPDPAEYNQSVDRYSRILADAAVKRGHTYVDVRILMEGIDSNNGIVPTAAGYRMIASRLADALTGSLAKWDIRIRRKQAESVGAKTSDLKWENGGLEIDIQDEQLPIPHKSKSTLQVQGLSSGSYRIQAAGSELGEFTADQLAKGVVLSRRAGLPHTEALRQKVIEKNMLFFHRHRPQNETYLFLFRKHEQGNNAVEVPKFDPLIRGVEARIHQLQWPSKHTYKITPIN